MELHKCGNVTLERVFLSEEEERVYEAMGFAVCKSCWFSISKERSCVCYPCLKSEDYLERRSLYREVKDGDHQN